MVNCDECGEGCSMPYDCSYCGRTLCGDHRLPENHECDSEVRRVDKTDNKTSSGDDEDKGLRNKMPSKDNIPTTSPSDRPHPTRLTLDDGRDSLQWLQNNVAYVFLGLMWVTFGLQFVVLPLLGIGVGSATWHDIFTLSTENPLFVWTWVTSIFSHGGLFHLIGNSFIIFFFAPVLEKRIGSKAFAVFALATGIMAGLGQLGLSLYAGEVARILGASGAALGILGALTVLNPNLEIFLFPLPVPLPLYALTGLYAVATVVGIVGGGVGAGGVAQVAHLVGLAVGLLYGQHIKPKVSKPRRLRVS